MIREINGDLIQVGKNLNYNIIAHQTNCKGVMGAGVAKQIRNQILSNELFFKYRNACLKYGSQLLGYVQFIEFDKEKKQYVANMFSQDGYGYGKKQTDYEAMKKCFKQLEAEARKNHLSVAIPKYIGCGLAGGNWDFVYNQIIIPIFENSEVELTIVSFEA